MDKHKAIDGFTMIEIMVVLFVLSLFIILSTIYSPKRAQLRFFMNILQDQYLKTQYTAIQKHKTIHFNVFEQYLNIDGEIWKYPNNIVCDHNSFILYPSGNVNHAGTIRCYKGSYQQSLIIHLGGGHAQLSL